MHTLRMAQGKAMFTNLKWVDESPSDLSFCLENISVDNLVF